MATSICVISKSVGTTSWSLYLLQSLLLTNYYNELQTHATFPKQTTYLVGFTLSKATKALRESKGIAVLYF
jgi:hypothetical protein